jgi:hypothetical protein
MTDLACRLAALRRPRLLIRTARFGLQDYRRTPALRRLFAAAGAHSPAQIVALLLLREAEQEDRRQAGDAAYSVARHVELLIALMAEARHLPDDAPATVRPIRAATYDRTPPPQAKASGIAAFRLETKSSSASRTATSSAGAW